MKQSEATPQRPFYSVSYQYARNPYATWTCNRLGRNPMANGGTTDRGTDDFELAKLTADSLIAFPYIRFAWVHKTTDCYNHSEAYKVENPNYTLKA